MIQLASTNAGERHLGRDLTVIVRAPPWPGTFRREGSDVLLSIHVPDATNPSRCLWNLLGAEAHDNIVGPSWEHCGYPPSTT